MSHQRTYLRFHGKPCCYCKRQMDRFSERLYPTRDHVFPRSKGGNVTVVCCWTCNGIKGNMLPEVWDRFMATFPKWWTMNVVEINRAKRSAFAARPEYRLPSPEAAEHRLEGLLEEVPLGADGQDQNHGRRPFAGVVVDPLLGEAD